MHDRVSLAVGGDALHHVGEDLVERLSPSWLLKLHRRECLADEGHFGRFGEFKAQGTDIPYTDENRDRVAEVPEVAAEIINIAVQLAAHRQEQEEGN